MKKANSLCFIFLLLYIFPSFLSAHEPYQFYGKHYLASYYDCNEEALRDIPRLQKMFLRSVEKSGATIVHVSSHEFCGSGLTMVVLLAESHASIHTYPEHRACFVDLFTCGNSCNAENFQKDFTKYLDPGKVNAFIFTRE